MKKIIIISLFVVVIIPIFISSCLKKDDKTLIENNENYLIFEDLNQKNNISPNFYDNHFYLIEMLGNNEEKENIISMLNEAGADLCFLNLEIMKKFHFNNSDIIMYSIPFLNSENIVVIYKYDDICQVNIAEYYTLENGKNQFSLKTLDNELFYSLQTDSDNRIGNFIIEKNYELQNFSNAVYSLREKKDKNQSDFELRRTCCRRASDWGACMNCTAAACGSSWVCVAALVVAGPETLAGFAVSCIGSGPDSFC